MLLFVISLQDSVFLLHMNSDSGFPGCWGELFWVRFVSQWNSNSNPGGKDAPRTHSEDICIEKKNIENKCS